MSPRMGLSGLCFCLFYHNIAPNGAPFNAYNKGKHQRCDSSTIISPRMGLPLMHTIRESTRGAILW